MSQSGGTFTGGAGGDMGSSGGAPPFQGWANWAAPWGQAGGQPQGWGQGGGGGQGAAAYGPFTGGGGASPFYSGGGAYGGGFTPSSMPQGGGGSVGLPMAQGGATGTSGSIPYGGFSNQSVSSNAPTGVPFNPQTGGGGGGGSDGGGSPGVPPKFQSWKQPSTPPGFQTYRPGVPSSVGGNDVMRAYADQTMYNQRADKYAQMNPGGTAPTPWDWSQYLDPMQMQQFNAMMGAGGPTGPAANMQQIDLNQMAYRGMVPNSFAGALPPEFIGNKALPSYLQAPNWY